MCRKIVITGAESTGKTTLSQQLAQNYHTIWIPEFAREYVENLTTKYTFNDVVKIAKMQIEQTNTCYQSAKNFIFFDTWLIITKIWFLDVFQHCPDFVDEAIKNTKIDLFLLCDNDLEWHFDPVRENPNRRDYFFNWYKNEIQNYGFNYKIVSESGSKRLNNAIQLINLTFNFLVE